MTSIPKSTTQRRRITIQGIVQGVGFRPFVYGLAQRWGLTGFVLNDSSGVTIEVEGLVSALDAFQAALHAELPPLARIDTLTSEQLSPQQDHAFEIVASQSGADRHALISPDTATCADCLRELFDPLNRRYHYPFINCTNCGPRFTIIRDVPYDRPQTTMSVFPMCDACRAEYENPLDRRFHAQPNACAVCGPSLQLILWGNQRTFTPANAIPQAVQAFIEGAILAIKGLGGYHLACDALNAQAVERLRQRKHREAKPFALMVPDLATAGKLCQVRAAEAALLQSHRRPIVLLERLPTAHVSVAEAVAPGSDILGIMLPYTPLHHLLLHAFAQALPPDRPAVLVMTSGNLSDEPIAYQDSDARLRLSSIADGMLTHNRTIHMRCDDTVMRIVAGDEQHLRRSRGYAPEPIILAQELTMPLLACGAHLKNTFSLGKKRQAFVSHHIGDLENLETLTSYREGIEHYQRLFDIVPEAIAYDLHPEYLATRYALDSDIPHKIGIQHHHAHIASVLAEHGLTGPVIGVAADGTGYGLDGTIWGGEILLADLIDFERHMHLRPIPLPGGEQAIRQPWRVAAAYLQQSFGDAFLELDIPFVQHLDRSRWYTLSQIIQRNINSPLTSSMGRLFDGVASLIGLRNISHYEGQAAIELETLAHSAQEEAQEKCYPFDIDKRGAIDTTPLIRAIVSDIQQRTSPAQIAARFHRSVVEMLVMACLMIREQSGLQIVALSGGVFQNRLLLQQLLERLSTHAFQVYTNGRVPPNDGGISLGQLAIASARLQNGTIMTSKERRHLQQKTGIP
jgi:hydrogenase maturation protein HypF